LNKHEFADEPTLIFCGWGFSGSKYEKIFKKKEFLG
jgi:hypothetical protein